MANRKKYQPSDIPGGICKLRVSHRRPRRKTDVPTTTIKCGCCDEKLVIDDFSEARYGILQINNVMGSKAEWRAVLEPLLRD